MRIADHCLPGGYRGGYEPAHPWPEDCYVQWGDDPTKRPADAGDRAASTFFEAFPTGTYLRGQGATLRAAEDRAWAQHQRELACPGHVWSPIGGGQPERLDGFGWCTLCRRAEDGVLPVRTVCEVCGQTVKLWSATRCRPCYDATPDEELTPQQRASRRMAARYDAWMAGKIKSLFEEDEPNE